MLINKMQKYVDNSRKKNKIAAVLIQCIEFTKWFSVNNFGERK